MKKETYFDTFSSAVSFAREQAEKYYQINESDWFNKVSIGGKPSEGTTKQMNNIYLVDNKTGRESKKCLHIQVYNNGITFELNYYIA